MPKPISMAATAQHNGDLDRAREKVVRAKLAELDGASLQSDQEGRQVNGQDTVYGSVVPSEGPAVSGLFFQGQQEGHQVNGVDPFCGYDAPLEDPATGGLSFQQQGPGHDAGAFLPHQAQPYFGGLDLPIQDAPPKEGFVNLREIELRQQPFPQQAPLPLQDQTQLPFTY
ncbi:hypothetical protein PV10_08142 [Exophiala mesophila]|uniref:Uncharacterized protein n=1 Tax=Exophiala mesophila TaxID=212818 RepID=A0A0D1Z3J2_EXOME|nr:uncharacterized protein PV10_08142 [Exophiala mesophila]KIV88459.1 hypothetical protein PV10_08142 [Exophiala mesophila]